MKHQKTIIAVHGGAGTGKTSILRELVGVLEANYGAAIRQFPPSPQPLGQGDVRWIGKIAGFVVAIETQGDPKTGLQDRLVEIAQRWQADVIFCATRTRGETVLAVEHVAQQYGHEQIWTSPYLTQGNHGIVNQLAAKHLLDLAKALGRLP